MESDLEDFYDGADLCLCCLKPVLPDANFCGDCGAPLGPLATMVPFQKVFAEGFIYRRAIGEPRSLLVVVGIWLLFGMLLGKGLFSLFSVWEQISGEGELVEWGGAVFPLGLVFCGAVGIVLVTRNYLRQKP